MELKVVRQIRTDNSTIGRFFINGKDTCWCLEPKDRHLVATMTLATIQSVKIDDKTAIPTGRYKVGKYYSPAHKAFVPRIINVPGFDYVEIHKGNFPQDTKACLLLGTDKAPDAVIHSAAAIDAFYPVVFKAIDTGEEVFITYS